MKYRALYFCLRYKAEVEHVLKKDETEVRGHLNYTKTQFCQFCFWQDEYSSLRSNSRNAGGSPACASVHHRRSAEIRWQLCRRCYRPALMISDSYLSPLLPPTIPPFFRQAVMEELWEALLDVSPHIKAPFTLARHLKCNKAWLLFTSPVLRGIRSNLPASMLNSPSESQCWRTADWVPFPRPVPRRPQSSGDK